MTADIDKQWSCSCPAEVLALFSLLQAVFLKADRLNTDEAGSVDWAEILQRVHGRLSLGVELLSLAGAALDVYVALVAGQTDFAVDALLGEQERVLSMIISIRASLT